MAPVRSGRARGFFTGSDTLEANSNIRTTWILAGLCALVAILAFANTIGHGFVYDDAEILRTPRLHDLGLWKRAFSRPYGESPQLDVHLWRPVTSLTLGACGTLNDLLGRSVFDPATFHGLNILVHAIASALVGVLALRLGYGLLAAAAVGMLFAVHPIHTEAVANVVQRAESLALLFGLAFLLLHRRSSWWSGLALLCAVASKESALGFVGVAFVWDFVSPRSRRPWSVWIGPAVAIAFFLVMRASALSGQVPRPKLLENPLATAPTWDRILTALRVQWLYVQLLVWPAHLSSDYSFDQIPVVKSILDLRVIGTVVLGVVAVGWAWLVRRSRPRIAVAVAIYVCLFAVTSNLLVPIGTIAGERLVYAPSVAFCLLVGEAMLFAVQRGHARIVTVVAVIVMLAGGLRTIDRNRIWGDEPTLFRDQVATAPRSAKAHLNLGIVLQRAGEDAEAARELEASLAIFPENSHTWYALGNALYNLRAEPKLVVQAFDNAVRYGPMHHDARVRYAIVLLKLHAPDLARQQIEMLARLSPEHPMLPELRAMLATEEQRPK